MKYVFSTYLANKAGEAVYRRRYESILHFHRAQPQTSEFLRLPDAPRRHKEKSVSPVRQSSDSESEPHPTTPPPKEGSSAVSGVRRSRRIAGSSVTEEPELEAEPPVKAATRRGRKQPHPLPQSPVKSMEEESEEEEVEEMDLLPTKERKVSQPPRSPPELSPVASPGEDSVAKPLPDNPTDTGPAEQPNGNVEKPDANSCHQISPSESPSQDQPHSEVNYTICHGTPETRKAANGPVQPPPRRQVEGGQQQPVLSPKSGSGEVTPVPESRIQTQAQSPGHDPPPTWPPPAQYPHPIPGGYPAMYGRHIAYPHASQTSANYPYLPYPWPHPPHAASQQGGADIQHAYHPQHMHPTVGSPPLPWPTAPRQVSPTQTSSRDLGKQPQLMSEAMSHQPVSGHLPPQPGHPLSYSHHPAHDPSSYPYGFESRHPSLAHIWPPTQISHPPLHPLISAPHLAASQSLWYPHPHAHHPAPHQRFPHRMVGMDSNATPVSSVTDKINKARSGEGGKSQLLEAKHNSNQSNNNNQQRAILDSVLLSRMFSSGGVSKASAPCLLTTTTNTLNPPINQCFLSVALPNPSAPMAISAILEQARLTNELSGNS